MDQIRAQLLHAWNARFLRDFQADERLTKTLVSPQGKELCRVMHSRKLEEWYNSPQGKARYRKPKCFFCERHDEYWCLDTVLRLGHLGVYFNIKFVAPCHYLISPLSEHRELMDERDVAMLQDLAIRSGLSIFGNFRDSGASYPEHVHYQSLDLMFPLTSTWGEEILSNGTLRLARMDYPVAAFRISPVGEDSEGTLVGRILTRLPRPYNPLFYSRNTFVIPRVKSVPANTNGFKFASAEVYGCVFTRSRETYDSFSYESMLAALEEVCLPAGSARALEFEQALLKAAEEVMAG